MPMHSGHPYSMPTCFWDDVATGFFHEWPNQDSATSDSTACAFLEAIAVEAETDISNIECGHSSLREHTMQRGRGHITSLCEVAAKSFCTFVGKYYYDYRESHDESEQPKEQPTGQQQQDQEQRKRKMEGGSSCKGKKGGGGSAWKAFLSEAAQGTKITRENMKDFVKRYHELTHDEYQRYVELGTIGMLAAREGHRNQLSLSSRKQQRTTHNQTDVGDDPMAIVQMEHADILVKVTGETFEEKFDSFKSMLKVRARDISSKRETQRTNTLEEREAIVAAVDATQGKKAREDLKQAGVTGFGSHLLCSAPPSRHVTEFTFKPPVAPFVKAALCLN